MKIIWNIGKYQNLLVTVGLLLTDQQSIDYSAK